VDKIVAHCPLCSAPMYGEEAFAAGGYQHQPAVRRTCQCYAAILRKLNAEAAKAEAEAQQAAQGAWPNPARAGFQTPPRGA
jgi:hypothetical protein